MVLRGVILLHLLVSNPISGTCKTLKNLETGHLDLVSGMSKKYYGVGRGRERINSKCL